MPEGAEKKRYFKSRELLCDEDGRANPESLEAAKKHTEKVKNKYGKELDYFTKIAKDFVFEKVLISEEEERPTIYNGLPEIISLPERYFANYSDAQKFVPDNRLKAAIKKIFFHERLHTLLGIAGDVNGFYDKLKEKLNQMESKGKKLDLQKEQFIQNVDILKILELAREENLLEEEAGSLSKEMHNFDKEKEEAVNRKMLNETTDLDDISSLAIVDHILSNGVIGARVLMHDIRKLQKNDATLIKELDNMFSNKFPNAHPKTIEKLRNGYIKIGGEILEKFDAWERENTEKPEN